MLFFDANVAKTASVGRFISEKLFDVFLVFFLTQLPFASDTACLIPSTTHKTGQNRQDWLENDQKLPKMTKLHP